MSLEKKKLYKNIKKREKKKFEYDKRSERKRNMEKHQKTYGINARKEKVMEAIRQQMVLQKEETKALEKAKNKINSDSSNEKIPETTEGQKPIVANKEEGTADGKK